MTTTTTTHPLMPDLDGVARSARQREMLDCLLSPEGLLPEWFDYSATSTRTYGSAGWKTFDGMRVRLEEALAGSPWTLTRAALGPRGGMRWVITERAPGLIEILEDAVGEPGIV